MEIAAEAWFCFGFDGAAPSYSAPATAGFDAASGQNLLAQLHGGFLERMAGARSLQVYRDGQPILSRELGGVADAIGAMRDCERETQAALENEGD